MNGKAAALTTHRLGRIGVWAVQLRYSDPGFIAEAAAELEELGYGAIWFPGGRGGDLNGAFLTILNATQHIVAASGILNIWMHEPEEVGSWWHAYTDAQRDRVMLGLGVGHADAIGEAWNKPLTKMAAYLDGLDAGADHVCLQVISGGPGSDDPTKLRQSWRELAPIAAEL